MRAKLLGAVLAALVIPTAMLVSLEAADVGKGGHIIAPVQAQTQESWTGLHIDAAVGGAFTRTDYDAITAGDSQLSSQNVLGSIGAGYDLQLSNIVLGNMADVAVSDLQ